MLYRLKWRNRDGRPCEHDFKRYDDAWRAACYIAGSSSRPDLAWPQAVVDSHGADKDAAVTVVPPETTPPPRSREAFR